MLISLQGLHIDLHAGVLDKLSIISLAMEGTICQSGVVCRPMCRVGT